MQEIIHLPDFDQKAARHQRNPEEIEIPSHVIANLIDYVSIVAGSYRNNHFHNFEHVSLAQSPGLISLLRFEKASHVVLSVMKLLSRIVAPAVEEQGETGTMAASLHDWTFGITSDPLTQFACAFTAMIHDAGTVA